MNETYDPKAKKILTHIEVNGQTLTVRDRVTYIGSSPCFVGKTGTLVKLKREWASARTRSRAGFAGKPGGYRETAYVLWDGPTSDGLEACPQSCRPDELQLAS